jgi:hypothetical protein
MGSIIANNFSVAVTRSNDAIAVTVSVVVLLASNE